MFDLLRRAFNQAGTEDAAPRLFSTGEGRRVYAIGDVHGRRDLLVELLRLIVADSEAREPVRELRLVMLGDLVDRGLESAGVVDLVMDMAADWPGMDCLMGNHEEMFLVALQGEGRGVDLFRRVGREALLSYGIAPTLIDEGEEDALYAAMLEHVPEAHRDFLAALPNSIVIGDYLFVHAGIKPGVALEDQDSRDMRWIRAAFLKSRVAHPYMVIHGHSISEEVDIRPNRIGIDTGAYASERLTAIGLEGTERWFLST
ncbi:MAG TPA: metallophosphoesterase family protein [Sphingobium sp.]